jgi:predicted adenine nucleotide alpha hydrolase (AANH) superfamily ATPase
MNKVDYNKLMKEQIKGIKALKQKPTLLLHVCCAPCSTTCIERLKDVFDITVFFYNPNMDSLDEYRKLTSLIFREVLLKVGVNKIKAYIMSFCVDLWQKHVFKGIKKDG